MTGSPITAFYAALTALVFVWLSLRVIALRRAEGISLGSGGDPVLERRIRAQANCAEYAPIGLVLLLLAEAQGLWPGLVHLFGALLLGGRVAHGHALGASGSNPAGRIGGMVLTLTQILVTALALLWLTMS